MEVYLEPVSSISLLNSLSLCEKYVTHDGYDQYQCFPIFVLAIGLYHMAVSNQDGSKVVSQIGRYLSLSCLLLHVIMDGDDIPAFERHHGHCYSI